MPTEPRARARAADGFDGRAAVRVPRQETTGAVRRLEIDEATYADDGFVVVAYDAGMDRIGASEPLAAGETFEGTLALERPLTDTQTVTVVLHHDEGGEPGERATVDDVVVLDNATVGRREFDLEGARR